VAPDGGTRAGVLDVGAPARRHELRGGVVGEVAAAAAVEVAQDLDASEQ
jgi:hypothetical protein